MRSSSAPGVGQRRSDRTQAADPQRNGGHCAPRLYIVGIGPGDLGHLSPRARNVLGQVDTIVGYRTYTDLIQPLIKDQSVVSTGMMHEIERAQAAIDTALQGRACAMISSGDPGIYAMAGLVLELCRLKGIPIQTPRGESAVGEGLCIEVVPGIPALAAGASLLGAPLTHDFAAVSLSDLLTPWSQIVKRLEAAAEADFVIVIYNPRSRRRPKNLDRACEIIQRYRSPRTPSGVVTGAMRANQRVLVTTLGDLPTAAVDMQTTLFIGNSATVVYRDFMITPRGYTEKYDLTRAPDADKTGRRLIIQDDARSGRK